MYYSTGSKRQKRCIMRYQGIFLIQNEFFIILLWMNVAMNQNQPSVTNFNRIWYMSNGCYSLKGQSHEVFDPRILSLNCTPGSPDSWATTVLHIDSNSRRYSTTKIDSALCLIGRSRLTAVPHSAESTRKFLTWISYWVAQRGVADKPFFYSIFSVEFNRISI
jgi:hypothetical protein